MICKDCGVDKPFTEFYTNKAMKSGYRNDCKGCVKARSKAHKESIAHLRPAQSRDYYERNKEAILAKNAAYHSENPDILQKARKNWKQRNPDKVNAATAKRRASKLNATPNWLTEEHHKDIEQFYWLAKDLCAVTGERYEVDHIVPLQGENVSGLHVPWNLQVLPRDINASKGNTTCPH